MMTTCERDDKVSISDLSSPKFVNFQDDSVDVDVEKLDEGIQIFGKYTHICALENYSNFRWNSPPTQT